MSNRKDKEPQPIGAPPSVDDLTKPNKAYERSLRVVWVGGPLVAIALLAANCEPQQVKKDLNRIAGAFIPQPEPMATTPYITRNSNPTQEERGIWERIFGSRDLHQAPGIQNGPKGFFETQVLDRWERVLDRATGIPPRNP